jgi:hypothetical protein
LKVLFMAVGKDDVYAFNEYGRANGGSNTEWIDWTAAHQPAADKQVTAVWYSGNPDPIMQNLGVASDQIYIRGHNDATLGTGIQVARGGSVVSAEEVALRVIKSGLRTRFQGKIKCYNCHSGEKFAGYKSSFAQALADYMYNHGYDNCTYYGYEGALDSFYKAGSKGTHKYRRDKVTTDGAMAQVEGGRASENRQQITPRFNLGIRAKSLIGK